MYRFISAGARGRRATARTLLAPAVALIAALAIPVAAAAAPPPNDARDAAAALSPPVTVDGTTAEATLEPGETSQIAGVPVAGSVWYRFSTARSRRVVIRLTANGDLDAAIAVIRRARSQFIVEQQATTDENGRALLYVDTRASAQYLIQVAQRQNSAPGTFRLELLLPELPPPPPGARLPQGGTSGSVDPLGNTADAWSVRLRAGLTYRILLTNNSTRRLRLGLYAPRTSSFLSNGPIRTSSGYLLFTPSFGEGGRYSLLVSATGVVGKQAYRLDVGRAGPDDMWPGIMLPNLVKMRGTFASDALDVVDTFRFDVVDRSAVRFVVRTSGRNGFGLSLRLANGRRIGTTTSMGTADVTRTLSPGRYVLVLRAQRGASGRYVLMRHARTLTHLSISAPRTTVPPGAGVTLRLRLTPGGSGRATVYVDRFDPATGWHFDRAIRTTVSGGAAVVEFRPPTIGRWRARASFAGTRTAEPSETPRTARFLVAGPLTP